MNPFREDPGSFEQEEFHDESPRPDSSRLIDMLRTTDGSLRFTAQEIEAFRALGIDAGQVRTDDDFARVFGEWLGILADQRPDLFDKITRAMLADGGASRGP